MEDVTNITIQGVDPPPQLYGSDWAVLMTLVLLGVLNLAATGYDLLVRCFNCDFSSLKSEWRAVRALRCFSLTENCHKLLSTIGGHGSSSELDCLNGLRVLAACHVITVHMWNNGPFRISLNDSLNGKGWWSQLPTAFYLGGVAFFVMSGLLTSYLLLHQLDNNGGRLHVGRIYLHRYLRLTPLYAVVLAFCATILPILRNGARDPLNPGPCAVQWWKNLLYINNFFFNDPPICMAHTWFLACEMQLFLITVLLVYVLWRWPKIGRSALVGSFVFFVAVTFFVYLATDPPILISRKESQSYANGFYTFYDVSFPHRASSYLSGVFLGYVLHDTKAFSQKKTLSTDIVRWGWALSVTISVLMIFGPMYYADEVQVPHLPAFFRRTFGPFREVIWSVVVSWAIYTCVLGYAASLNRFLSWRGFRPLARLTYCVYLIHTELIGFLLPAGFFGGDTITDWLLANAISMATSFGVAFFICLSIEIPFLNLERIVSSSLAGRSPS